MTPPPAPEKGTVRKSVSFLSGIFTKHLAVKFAALLLAFLVWFTVRRDLLATWKDQPVDVKVVLDEGLMVTSDVPPSVRMELQGPTSQINVLKRQGRLQVTVPVHRDDLAGQLQAPLIFSPERGNIEVGWSDEVRIVSMEPSEIRIEVAVVGRKTVEVRAPEVTLTNPQWTLAQVSLVAPEVELSGPQEVLDNTPTFQPPPVDGDALVAPRPPDEEEYTVERLLTLPRALAERHVRIVDRETFRARITFRREGDERRLAIPFRILAPPGEQPGLRIFPKGGLVTKTEDGDWTIDLLFRGTPRNLDFLAQEIGRGMVFAYVLAGEFSFWKEGKESVGSAAPQLHLQLPEDLDGRIRFVPPQDLSLATEKKEEEK